MQLIYPSGSKQLADSDIASLYAYPEIDAGDLWVRANFVASLDGAIQGPDQRSRSLSSAPDQRVFAALRRLADVILVGATTARVEGYGPVRVRPEEAYLRENCQHSSPRIAVVSRSLDFDVSSPLFAEDARTIVLTVNDSPSDRRDALSQVADVIVAGDSDLDVAAALHELAERGLPRVLCEGGAHLLGSIVEADCLDELCYTVSPTLVGGNTERLIATPTFVTSDWHLAHVLAEDSTLLTRWLANRSRT